MDKTALSIVKDYICKQFEKAGIGAEFDLYIVWKAKALQNWKYLISTSLLDGRYYELTYNGDKAEWYLDVYRKVENRVVPGVEAAAAAKTYAAEVASLNEKIAAAKERSPIDR